MICLWSFLPYPWRSYLICCQSLSSVFSHLYLPTFLQPFSSVFRNLMFYPFRDIMTVTTNGSFHLFSSLFASFTTQILKISSKFLLSTAPVVFSASGSDLMPLSHLTCPSLFFTIRIKHCSSIVPALPITKLSLMPVVIAPITQISWMQLQAACLSFSCIFFLHIAL